jgi:iron complex outermembrane recepter protein
VKSAAGAFVFASACWLSVARAEPPLPASDRATSVAATSDAASPDPAPINVEISGQRRTPERGVYDLTLRRDLLLASPRLQTSELLSAAPGFFVDHEDGEGLGNDVYLRGFDLSHGSGIEMKVGRVPINSPSHVRGQGYADVNFLLPEVVRSIRVLEGPYDPRQGDAAIVGSAEFELGVAERGVHGKLSYGSFDQLRALAIAAPRAGDEQTFAAFALRKTDGFGARRASRSGTLNAQWAIELGTNDRLTLLAVAYAARAELPGVVREDDVEAGRLGFYDSYPHYAGNQSSRTGRVLISAEYRHEPQHGPGFVIAPWAMWTDLRVRENYTGVLEVSRNDPSVFARGDLFETADRESALGVTASVQPRPLRLGRKTALGVEPGFFLRGGNGRQRKSLIDPDDTSVWDRRLDAELRTLDAGAYLDLDLNLGGMVEVTGGLRADLLLAEVDDRLAGVNGSDGENAGAMRSVAGVAAGPRITVAYQPTPGFSAHASYGEGFRSLPVPYLEDGMSRPFSKVRSIEVGLGARVGPAERVSSRLALFQTWVEHELVFVAEEAGLDTQNRSARRGVVGSFVYRPSSLLLASSALSVTDAKYQTKVAGISHRVPNVPPLLFRTDVSLRGALHGQGREAYVGRLGVGYTFLSGQHLSDLRMSAVTHRLNAGAAVRRGPIELGIDVYDVLGLETADRADLYVSNWSLEPGQQPASPGTHVTAAPPRTVLASLGAYY